MSRALFFGSKPLGLACLRVMHELAPGSVIAAVTFDDHGDSRSALPGLERFADEAEIPLTIAASRHELDEAIRVHRPSLAFGVGWYWLIPRETLAMVPRGIVGIHNSLLPRYRGGSPLNWAIINGEDTAGISLFALSEGMDEGGVLGQRAVAVGPDDHIGDVLERIETAAQSLVKDTYLDLLAGTLPAVPQDHASATYCAQRTPDDGVIDWRQPARRIYDFIRAQTEPYPGAFTHVGGHRCTVWRARPLSAVFHGTPGQVARVTADGVQVICGDARPLLVTTVQLDGEDRAPAHVVLRSIRLRLGEQV